MKNMMKMAFQRVGNFGQWNNFYRSNHHQRLAASKICKDLSLWSEFLSCLGCTEMNESQSPTHSTH